MENSYIFALVFYLVIINPFIRLSITSDGIYLILLWKQYIVENQGFKENTKIRIYTLIKY